MNKKTMKKLIVSTILAFILMSLALVAQQSVVFAANGAAPSPLCGPNDLSPRCAIQSIGQTTGLPDFETGQHSDAPADYEALGVGTVTSPIYYVIDLFRYVISGIAMIVVVVNAVKLVGGPGEDEAQKIKSALMYAVGGLILINLADVIVKEMFFGERGEAFEDVTTAELFAEETVSQVRGIIGFINAFVAAVAVLVIIVRGFTVMVSGGDEEALNKAKQHVLYGAVGLVIVGISELVVRGIIFPEQGDQLVNVSQGRQLIVSLTNYLSGFIAIFAFLVLFYAGYIYVTSAGNEEATEKVKKIILGAVIALFLSLGAYAMVNTLVKFEEPEPTQVAPQEESLP